MSAYGVHPTRYGNLSNEQLYSMFRESSYSKLDESEKLDLLQETVNRDALERGEIGAPEVRFADLPANESGNASNGIINVNRDLAVNGVQSIEYNGQTIQHSVRAYNIEYSTIPTMTTRPWIHQSVWQRLLGFCDVAFQNTYTGQQFGETLLNIRFKSAKKLAQML